MRQVCELSNWSRAGDTAHDAVLKDLGNHRRLLAVDIAMTFSRSAGLKVHSTLQAESWSASQCLGRAIFSRSSPQTGQISVFWKWRNLRFTAHDMNGFRSVLSSPEHKTIRTKEGKIKIRDVEPQPKPESKQNYGLLRSWTGTGLNACSFDKIFSLLNYRRRLLSFNVTAGLLPCYLVPLIRILVLSWIVWIFEDPFFSIFVFIFSNSFGYGILCVWLLESRTLWTFPIKFTQKVGCSTWHKLVKRHVFERFALFIAVTTVCYFSSARSS